MSGLGICIVTADPNEHRNLKTRAMEGALNIFLFVLQYLRDLKKKQNAAPFLLANFILSSGTIVLSTFFVFEVNKFYS